MVGKVSYKEGTFVLVVSVSARDDYDNCTHTHTLKKAEFCILFIDENK